MSQPAPTPNNNPHIVELVKADLDRRRALGIQRYGTALQAGNGRDALKDAYEEALDLCQYLKQALMERDSGEPTQLRLVAEAALSRLCGYGCPDGCKLGDETCTVPKCRQCWERALLREAAVDALEVTP